MRPASDIVWDLAWEGESVLVVGSGASRDSRPDRWTRQISANHWGIDGADLAVTCHQPWGVEGILPHGVPCVWVEWGPSIESDSIYKMPSAGKHGWARSMQHGVYWGGYSGYCAAQIADALVGPGGTVYLAGFDCGLGYSYEREWLKHCRPQARFVQMSPSSPLQFDGREVVRA